MSKKDYIDAVNEIEVKEELKTKTLMKIKETKKTKKYNKIYPLASLAIACAVIMTIVLPNMTIAPINEKKYSDIKESSTMPRVENFENLYAMLRERAENEEDRYFEISDSMVSVDSAESTNGAIKQENTAENKEYSETNVQVEGVDEADIVKTDGKYIYYLANSNLTITDVNNNIVLVTKLEFDTNEFYPQEIYLRGSRVVVIGSRHYREEKNKIINTYSTYTTYTVAKTYNVENKANPILERNVEVEGTYLSSRMIGDNLYLITNKYIDAYLCKKHRIQNLEEEDFKTKYIDTAISNNVETVDFDCIYYIPEFEETSYLNIAAFNITANNPISLESYLGAGNEVYASTDNLYITKVKYSYDEYDVNTEIYKFNLKDATCTFEKTGSVPGSVLNQFSMDEKDGYFRIATTDSKSWSSEDNTNNLYVLNENLEIVGKVEGLAPGERIYSVRFMGNRAYMVTFVQTDPLFVIDLSEPTNPIVLGELKIPGYSKYLHPYDETHLIGFGEDTKLVNYGYGDVVTTDGMKMSLFDVTDPSDPKEMYTEKIGGKGTYSELLYNHKALLFSKEKNIIAFPISITGDDYNVTFQGAIVYGLTLNKGFELKGKISNTANELDKYYSVNSVQRIIYIGDTLYTLSNSLIKATDMNTMKETGHVDLSK